MSGLPKSIKNFQALIRKRLGKGYGRAVVLRGKVKYLSWRDPYEILCGGADGGICLETKHGDWTIPLYEDVDYEVIVITRSKIPERWHPDVEDGDIMEVEVSD